MNIIVITKNDDDTDTITLNGVTIVQSDATRLWYDDAIGVRLGRSQIDDCQIFKYGKLVFYAPARRGGRV